VIGAVFLIMLTATAAVIVVVDLRQRLIPNLAVVALCILGLLRCLITAGWHAGPWLVVLTASIGAAAVLYLLRSLLQRVVGAEPLGLGDVKLAGASGIWVGLVALPTLFFVAAAVTLLALPIRTALRRHVGTHDPADREIPFGPGLCFATALIVGLQLAGVPVPPL
jgi:leader peptidase (prepilin peptidase)/N-methyltransferase